MEMHNEILESKEVRFGKDHLLTNGTRRQIADCFLKMGKYPEALDVFQKVISIEEEEFGVDHPDTLDTKEWLAKTLEKMGKNEEALKIYEEVLTAYEKVDEPHYDEFFVGEVRERGRHLKVLIKKKMKNIR